MEAKHGHTYSLDHIEMQKVPTSEENTSNVNSVGIVRSSYKCYAVRKLALKCLGILICIGFNIYVAFAIIHDPVGAILLCISTPLVTCYVLNLLTNRRLAKVLGEAFKYAVKCCKPGSKQQRWIRRISTVAFPITLIVFLAFDIRDDFEKWRPLGGLAIFLAVSVVFSRHPSKINWTPVVWGILLQFSLGLVILRWRSGFLACHWFGNQVTTLLGYTDTASKFVFGDYTKHPVVFKILPVVVFFSAVVSLLYYVGLMQFTIQSIAAILQYVMKTTPIESFATAAHIFIGQVESSVALKPFLSKLTESELHALMTSGFATVAGTVVAAYVQFGVAAEDVISASFMSAPAALAIAKISLPETRKSRIKTMKDIDIPTGQESNFIEALSVGATNAIQLIAYVVVNLIAFVAVLTFLDAVISYLGGRVGYSELSFHVICSYIFMPLAFLMGVPWSDCKIVGQLIGKKIILNEFLAYADLGEMIKNGILEGRSAVVSTYILCGFGSIAALGINIGCLSSACPERRSDFARLAVRAMINGNIACFMTACIAGMLYQGPDSAGVSTTSPYNTVNTTAQLDDFLTTIQTPPL